MTNMPVSTTVPDKHDKHGLHVCIRSPCSRTCWTWTMTSAARRFPPSRRRSTTPATWPDTRTRASSGGLGVSCQVMSCLMCHVIGVMSFLVPLLVTSCLLSLVSCYLSHVGSCFMCHVICVMSLLMCHDKLIPVSRHVMSWLMCHVTSYVSCYLYHVMSCLFLFDMLSVSCHFFCVMIPVSRQVFYVQGVCINCHQ